MTDGKQKGAHIRVGYFPLIALNPSTHGAVVFFAKQLIGSVR